MELKQNINRVHGDLTNYFENVQISEKSNKELGNYFELSVLENNKEVKAIIKMTEIENANFSWNYYANPLDENSLVERVSSIYTFSSDVQDIFEKNRFSSDYIVENLTNSLEILFDGGFDDNEKKLEDLKKELENSNHLDKDSALDLINKLLIKLKK
jgi:hypothetical protein